jgi:hypothetical protein
LERAVGFFQKSCSRTELGVYGYFKSTSNDPKMVFPGGFPFQPIPPKGRPTETETVFAATGTPGHPGRIGD